MRLAILDGLGACCLYFKRAKEEYLEKKCILYIQNLQTNKYDGGCSSRIYNLFRINSTANKDSIMTLPIFGFLHSDELNTTPASP